MTATSYAVVMSLVWAMLQGLAVLRLPEGWAPWSCLPNPTLSSAALAAGLIAIAPISESHAALALGTPVALLYLAFLSFSWAAVRGG